MRCVRFWSAGPAPNLTAIFDALGVKGVYAPKRSYNRARLPSPAQWVTVNRIRVKDSYTDMEFLSDEFSEKFVPIGFI